MHEKGLPGASAMPSAARGTRVTRARSLSIPTFLEDRDVGLRTTLVRTPTGCGHPAATTPLADADPDARHGPGGVLRPISRNGLATRAMT